ncbi:MAG: GMC family oxidoreductase [Chlamydiia bacterium]|nr:GMC family oxidoreductase [Chlamydiia bacterium]
MDYDIIIIGTGAGGGTLAHSLAQNTDKKILILERGPFLKRERENWDAKAVFVDGRYHADETWINKDNHPFHPGIHYFVGGNTKVYGGALFRFRERDFEEIAHEGGLSPAWPISYHDLAPFYDQAEKLYHVHGQRGADPTEPPTEHPYPHPPVSHEPRIQELFQDFQKQGLNPFPLPLGILLDEEHPHKSACIRCDAFDGFPCLVNGKADAHVICIDPLLNHPNVTLLTEAKVEKLLTNPSGDTITSVEVTRNGKPENYSAKTVVVSCGAINSALLLLRSANDKHPNGLANRSGVVGRHYMCHNNSAFVAVSTRPNPTKFQKTFGINDFYFGAEDCPYPLGHIQMLGKSHAAMFEPDAPRITPHIALDKLAKHAVDFWLTSEDLPDLNNHVFYDSQGRVHLHYTENNLTPHRQLQEKLKGLLKHIGCEPHLIPTTLYLGKKIPIAGTAHQSGTIRFGTDPTTSALDTHCKAHDLTNLYVVDSSFFPSSTAVNPALTIMANALRIAHHLQNTP